MRRDVKKGENKERKRERERERYPSRKNKILEASGTPRLTNIINTNKSVREYQILLCLVEFVCDAQSDFGRFGGEKVEEKPQPSAS